MEEPGAAAADALISGASDVQVMSSDPGARAPDGMAAEGGAVARNNDEPNDASFYLHVFELYETQSNFYMIRKNRSRTSWRLLKIGRLRASELNICQESTTYTESECKELLNRIHEENKSTGGLKFVTDCYGIVGFVKFLGPYYMLLITEREEIGAILGHTIYAITKSKIIALPNSSVQSNMANSREERRYKKLFCTVDITQGFFFSYSYSIMQSLQKNMCEGKTGQMLYESMFIWNEFLTREIHSRLKSTLWTVYLVYGFFKQVKLSTHGKDFWLTLIARRSQHCAGTRYLKRGVDEDGNVANDVETEQIIFEDIPGKIPTCFSSIVQNRGSIPLFWSQETSKLNLKPDIILNKDKGYEATKLHFDNLAERYGKPIVILNLIKSEEKKPRESILRSEFASAVKYVDKNLSEDSHLKFLHWDLHKHYRSKAKNVLTMLVEVAACTLMLTDFFYCEMAPALRYESDLRWPTSVMDDAGDQSSNNICSSSSCSTTDKDDVDMQENGSQENMDSDISGSETNTIVVSNGGLCSVKSLRCQKGVLRTNCIDCLDRTNIAQYAYGLVALGHQLHALKLSPCPSIPLDATLADHLMTYYEKMGDKLSLQYGGSTAHNKIFSERRGQCKATIRYQELLRTFQRYYSNAFTDVDKQAAIDLFLGQFQPQLDKPAIWEDCGVGKSGHGFTNEISRSFIRRSLSDGNILHEIYTLLSSCSFSQNAPSSSKSSQVGYSILPYPIYRYTAVVPHGQHFAESADSYLYKDWYSNFLDFESILSSQSFLEGEMNDRSTSNSPIESPSTQNIADGRSNEASSDLVENGSITEGDQVIEEQPHDTVRTANKRNKFPDSFAHWVHHGEALYR